MIVKIEPSKVKYKRYCITMDNGREYNFGLDTGSTYIDHHDKVKRKNYWKRHLGNKTEYKLITNLVPSSSLFSAFILWGKYTNINQNIDFLNELWNDKHEDEEPK